MNLKLIFALFFGLFCFHVQAQADKPQIETEPQIQIDQLDQLSDLFEGFDFGDMGGGMFMDTMMIRQFGGSDFQSGDMDQMMQQMMEMMQMQMSQFDFESMDLNQLFDEFDLDNLQPYSSDPDQITPGDQNDTDKLNTKKKIKTYKL